MFKKKSIVTFFHPFTNVLVRGIIIHQDSFDVGSWWIKTDDGYGYKIGAADLMWKYWMLPKIYHS